MDGVVDNFSRELTSRKKKSRTHASGVTLQDIDASLQEFAYTFECGSRIEKLSFRTFQDTPSPGEHEELLSVYSDRQVMFAVNGVDLVVESDEEIEELRSHFRAQRSLFGELKAIKWKLYYCRDINRNTRENDFVGVCGLSINESKQLSPSIRLRQKYQQIGIGTKIVFAVLEKLLRHKSLLFANIRDLWMDIHPMNEQSLSLKTKILSDHVEEDENPDDHNGIWHPIYRWFGFNSFNALDMRIFVCNKVEVLETLLTSKMNQKINKADLLFYNILVPDEDCQKLLLNGVSGKAWTQDPVKVDGL